MLHRSCNGYRSYDPYEIRTPQTPEVAINENNEDHKAYLDNGSGKDEWRRPQCRQQKHSTTTEETTRRKATKNEEEAGAMLAEKETTLLNVLFF